MSRGQRTAVSLVIFRRSWNAQPESEAIDDKRGWFKTFLYQLFLGFVSQCNFVIAVEHEDADRQDITLERPSLWRSLTAPASPVLRILLVLGH